MWTEERKAKMRLQIQEWKPWEKSTGAKTPEGKAVSSKNALKHGAFSAENLKQNSEFRHLLRQ
jgi:hypothetical protein